MDQAEYAKLINYVKAYLYRKKLNLHFDAQDIAHDIWLKTKCDKCPPYLHARIIDQIRFRWGSRFQRKDLYIVRDYGQTK